MNKEIKSEVIQIIVAIVIISLAIAILVSLN